MVSESRDRTPVLDHGYVEFVESWGSDERIVEAARMSTAKGFLGWGPKHAESCPALWNFLSERPQVDCDCVPAAGDEKLLGYLWEHHHTTPFEMAGMTVEVQAPIFVFREWHRHRTQSYNELSARYTPLPDVNYVPSVERCMIDGGKNKQAQGITTIMTPSTVDDWLSQLSTFYDEAEALYQRGLKTGIPKEVARLCLPVGRYSRMRASTDLWNWLHFLRLRMDKNAQWEIQQYAVVVGDLIADKFPRTWELFTK